MHIRTDIKNFSNSDDKVKGGGVNPPSAFASVPEGRPQYAHYFLMLAKLVNQ
jgi:hypothetical protein